jgi:hypothetical protein
LLSFSYDFENWQLKFITTGIGSMDTYMAPTITGPLVYKEYFSWHFKFSWGTQDILRRCL